MQEDLSEYYIQHYHSIKAMLRGLRLKLLTLAE